MGRVNDHPARWQVMLACDRARSLVQEVPFRPPAEKSKALAAAVVRWPIFLDRIVANEKAAAEDLRVPAAATCKKAFSVSQARLFSSLRLRSTAFGVVRLSVLPTTFLGVRNPEAHDGCSEGDDRGDAAQNHCHLKCFRRHSCSPSGRQRLLTVRERSEWVPKTEAVRKPKRAQAHGPSAWFVSQRIIIAGPARRMCHACPPGPLSLSKTTASVQVVR